MAQFPYLRSMMKRTENASTKTGSNMTSTEEHHDDAEDGTRKKLKARQHDAGTVPSVT